MATPISQVANGFSDPLLYEPGIVPVVNLFIKSYWRLAALARLSLPYFGISFGPLLIFIEVLIRLGIYAARLYGFQILNPGETYILKHMTLRVTTAAMRKWPYVFTTIWWLLYQLFADVGDFELDYIGAWRHKLEQSSNSSPVEVHLYVENNYLKAPIPTRLDDAATLRALQMWYCLLQSKMGTGEILLPKRLIRIDRVRVGTSDCFEMVATNAPNRYLKPSFVLLDLAAKSNRSSLEDQRTPILLFSRIQRRSRAR